MLVLLLVEAVRERGGGGLIDDAEDFQPGNLTRILGRLALGIIEIRGNCYDSLRDLFTQVRFGIGLDRKSVV